MKLGKKKSYVTTLLANYYLSTEVPYLKIFAKKTIKYTKICNSQQQISMLFYHLVNKLNYMTSLVLALAYVHL